MKLIGRNKFETNRFYLRKTKKKKITMTWVVTLITKREYFDKSNYL